jgi:hypothetical protein
MDETSRAGRRFHLRYCEPDYLLSINSREELNDEWEDQGAYQNDTEFLQGAGIGVEEKVDWDYHYS